MPVQAKFRCDSKTSDLFDASVVQVQFSAVYGDGEANKEWSKWTPSGKLTMQITNPAANEQFEVGKEYYLNITAVE